MSQNNNNNKGPFCVTGLDWGKEANRLQAMGTAKWVQRKAGNCSAHQLGKQAKQLRNHRLNHEQSLVWNLGTELRARVFNSKTWTLIQKSKLSTLDRTVCQPKHKKTQSSNRGTLPEFLIDPLCYWKFAWIQSLPPNLLRKKNQLSKSEDAISLLSNSQPGSIPF